MALPALPARASLIAALAAAIALAAPAAAAACDPFAAAERVSHGVSPSGVAWEQRAKVDVGGLHLFTDLDEPFDDWGGGVSADISGARGPWIVPEWTGGFGKDEGDGLVAGAASARVASVRVLLEGGLELGIPTHRAPKRALRREPALRLVRFFARSYTSDAAPALFVGYDDGGAPIAWWPPPLQRSQGLLARAACLALPGSESTHPRRWRLTVHLFLWPGADPGLPREAIDDFLDRAVAAVADRRNVLRVRRMPQPDEGGGAMRIVARAPARDRPAAKALARRLLNVAFDAGVAALPADTEVGWGASTAVRPAR